MEKNKKAYTVFAWAALCLLAFTFIFPLYWIVTGSFKLQTATVQLPPQWFPAEPTVANYVKLFKNPAGLWLWNSVFPVSYTHLVYTQEKSAVPAERRFSGSVTFSPPASAQAQRPRQQPAPPGGGARPSAAARAGYCTPAPQTACPQCPTGCRPP